MQTALYSTNETSSLTQRISTMLTLYAVYILALSSSVIAAPSGRPALLLPPPGPPPPTHDGVYKEFIGKPLSIQDQYLITGDWGRVTPTPWAPDWHRVVLNPPWPQKDPTPSRRTVDWTYARNCDDFIQFRAQSYGGVTHVTTLWVHRVKRKIENWMYKIDRHTGYRLECVYPDVPMKDWGKFLNDTKWVREPDIAGEVSNGVTVWKSLMRFIGSPWGGGQSRGHDTLLTHE
jgi:hypothetical protein